MSSFAQESISRIGIILSKNDDNNQPLFLIMKRIDRSWVDTDGCKVKWGFPKTGQNITHNSNILRTALNVCENKLKTKIATTRFHYIYKIIPYNSSNRPSKSVEYYWLINEKFTGEFDHLYGTQQDETMDTYYMWATIDDLYKLNRNDDICYGTKRWMYDYMEQMNINPKSRRGSPISFDGDNC